MTTAIDRLRSIERECDRMTAELRALREENERLQVELSSLQHSDEYLAGAASMMPLVRHHERERDAARRERDLWRALAADAIDELADAAAETGNPERNEAANDFADRRARLRDDAKRGGIAGTEGSGT